MNCSRVSKSRTNDSCLTKKELQQVSKETVGKTLSGNKKDIIKKLESVLTFSFSSQEHLLFRYIKDPYLRFHVKYMLFKPEIKDVLSGLMTEEINTIMYQSTYGNTSFKYLGTFPADHTLKIPKNSGVSYGFIMNTKPGGHSGEHWCAFFIKGNHVKFFDSNGSQPNKYHKKIYNQFDKQEYNKIAYQKTDGLCGLYAINFLLCESKSRQICQTYQDSSIKKILKVLF